MYIIVDGANEEKQREQLNAKLGLDVCNKLGISTDNLFTDKDLQIDLSNTHQDNKVGWSYYFLFYTFFEIFHFQISVF